MKRIAALVGVLALMMVPGMAFAQSSTCQQYNPELCSSVDSTTGSSGPTDSTNASTAGTLPFTGLDVVLLVAGGGALLSAGFVVRRVSRRLD
jgi:hypothetical protein